MRIRQIVFAARDLAASRQALGQLLALPAPFRDPGVAEFGLDNAVFCFGDQFIEVISPTQDGTACGRHLDRHGESPYMLILQTDDLARDRTRLHGLGVRSVWQADHPDISATHLHPKDVGAAIVSVDEPRPAASWRWGGPDWRVADGDAGRQRVRGLTVAAARPEALADHWASLFDRPLPQRHGEAWRVRLTDGFVDMVAVPPGGHEGITGFTLEVADPAAVQARARSLGLAVAAGQVQWLGATLALHPLHAAAT
jgi:hypothetical protein